MGRGSGWVPSRSPCPVGRVSPGRECVRPQTGHCVRPQTGREGLASDPALPRLLMPSNRSQELKINACAESTAPPPCPAGLCVQCVAFCRSLGRIWEMP